MQDSFKSHLTFDQVLTELQIALLCLLGCLERILERGDSVLIVALGEDRWKGIWVLIGWPKEYRWQAFPACLLESFHVVIVSGNPWCCGDLCKPLCYGISYYLPIAGWRILHTMEDLLQILTCWSWKMHVPSPLKINVNQMPLAHILFAAIIVFVISSFSLGSWPAPTASHFWLVMSPLSSLLFSLFSISSFPFLLFSVFCFSWFKLVFPSAKFSASVF